ncbi:hypothetical protein [Phreatobacter oligotrophus]|uniref:Uncharacterized protein n=1 Tax=Phreatobacter oligotrophus TaxID=1122261 RepID=A0A2T4YXH2_9HYPH|nr:hypothetical protein [Phreatobacter oligotrophus]PTM50884.1 hypothetical protein C8P69_11246 [Phreatobacter oligotrophus]
MRPRLSALLVALAAGLLTGAPAEAQTAGPRGLNGTTWSTSRVPGDAAGLGEDLRMRGVAGVLLFRDPRYQNQLLPCDDTAALEKIQRRFAEKEERFWNSSLSIRGFDHVRLVTTNPYNQNLIPRRFCTARAVLSDGRVRRIDYAIMEDQGIIGASFGVEWCVSGLDRGRSFDPACRMARP